MKELLKSCANALAGAVMLPFCLLYGGQTLVCGSARVFSGWSQGLSLLPGFCGVYLRRAFYRVLSIGGEDSYIGFGTVFSHATIRLGRRVYIGLYGTIGDAIIADDVLISSHVSIINGGGQHGSDETETSIREQPGEYPQISIGMGSWIGERAIVMAAVGRHCIVGAGAVVTRPVPDYAIVVGCPARVLRFRRTACAGSDSPELT